VVFVRVIIMMAIVSVVNTTSTVPSPNTILLLSIIETAIHTMTIPLHTPLHTPFPFVVPVLLWIMSCLSLLLLL